MLTVSPTAENFQLYFRALGGRSLRQRIQLLEHLSLNEHMRLHRLLETEEDVLKCARNYFKLYRLKTTSKDIALYNKNVRNPYDPAALMEMSEEVLKKHATCGPVVGQYCECQSIASY